MASMLMTKKEGLLAVGPRPGPRRLTILSNSMGKDESAMIFHLELCQIVRRISFGLRWNCDEKQFQEGAFSINITYIDHTSPPLPLLGRSNR